MSFLFITRAQKVSGRINKIFLNKVFTGFADLYSNVQECDATDAPLSCVVQTLMSCLTFICRDAILMTTCNDALITLCSKLGMLHWKHSLEPVKNLSINDKLPGETICFRL